MKTLEDYAQESEYAQFHLDKLRQYSDEQHQIALEMIHKLEAVGCIDPLPRVMSELEENIPQTAIFGVLREIYMINQRSADGLNEIGQNDEKFRAIVEVMGSVISSADFAYFCKALSKSLSFDFLMLLDDCPQPSGLPSWGLKEFDADGNETGRFISGLHEDFEDFELEGNRMTQMRE
jgi:hypothetical protein